MDDEVRELLSSISASHSGHLPVVAAFLRRIGLAEAVNRAVPSRMEVDIGDYVSLMVLDTLSGRSPLYHLAKFASAVDTQLLLGSEIPASAFNDTAVGRAMDAIFLLRNAGSLRRRGHGRRLGLPLGRRLAPRPLRHHLGFGVG